MKFKSRLIVWLVGLAALMVAVGATVQWWDLNVLVATIYGGIVGWGYSMFMTPWMFDAEDF